MSRKLNHYLIGLEAVNLLSLVIAKWPLWFSAKLFEEFKGNPGEGLPLLRLLKHPLL